MCLGLLTKNKKHTLMGEEGVNCILRDKIVPTQSPKNHVNKVIMWKT